MTAHICYCRTALPLTDPDFHTKLPTCPAREEGEEGKKTLHASHLFTFLCLPLNTTAKAPCPTRSFLLYSKSPTVSIVVVVVLQLMLGTGDSLECCSPVQIIILAQMIHSVLVTLLLALRIYFMPGCWDVSYCINKRCSQDMVHWHAL